MPANDVTADGADSGGDSERPCAEEAGEDSPPVPRACFSHRGPTGEWEPYTAEQNETIAAAMMHGSSPIDGSGKVRLPPVSFGGETMQFEVSQSVQHGAPDGFMHSISSTDWKVLKQDTSVPLLEKYYCRSLSLLFSLLILIWRRFVPDPLGARRLKFEASDGISDGYDASQSEGETRCSLFAVRETGYLISVLLHSLTANSHVTTHVCAPTCIKNTFATFSERENYCT